MRKPLRWNHKNTVPFTHAQLMEMAEMYRKGQSSRLLSEKYGMSKSAILRRLHAMGVLVRKIGSRVECEGLRGRYENSLPL